MAEFKLSAEQKKQAELAADARFKTPIVNDILLFTTGGVTANDLGGDSTGLQLNHIKAIDGVEVKMDGYTPRRAFGAEAPTEPGKPIYGEGGYKYSKKSRKVFDDIKAQAKEGKLKPTVNGTPRSLFAADEIEKVEAKIKEQITAAQEA